MADLPHSIGAITIFVGDVARSTAFYRTVFGDPPVFQDENSAVFRFGSTLVNLLAVQQAPELVAPGTVADLASGARFVLSIWVDDVDAAVARLAELRVGLVNGPVDREWGKRTASFADPDGTLWEIAQDIPPVAGG